MKTKKILKSIVSLLLVVMMLMSVGIASISSAVVDLAQVGATITSDGTARLYFNMKAVSWWTAGTNGNGNFAYFFNSSTNAWSAHAVNYSGNTYYVVIPSGSWETVILTRNNTSTAPSWDNDWNQTGNITLSSTSNYISSFSEGSSSVTWGTAIKPTSNAALSASATSVAPGASVTLTPSLSSNSTLNTIKSTTYSVSPSSGASVSGNTFTATASGTYTVTATVTYHPNGYSGITSTATASTTITVASSEYSYTVTAGTGGTITSADSGTVNQGSGATVTASANAGYRFDKWTSSTGTFADATKASTTFTPSQNNANALASFIKTYTVSASANPASGGTATTDKFVVDTGASVTLTATADSVNGYAFTGWTINGTAVGDATNSTLVVDNVTENITAVANFQQIPTNSVSVTANPPEAGTVSPVQQDVAEGSKVDLTAYPNTGYTFTGWSITGSYTIQSGTVNSQAFSIIPLAEITAQANFRANTATVTVNAQSGGTVTNAGANATAYPGTVTSTAAENTDYTFAGWTITGTLDTDYELVNCSASDKTITIRPIKDGASITATAKFLLGQYLTVYTFSADGYDNLTVTESNGTTTNTVVDALPQPDTATFGTETWDASAQMQLTNGYSSSVTAQLSGEGGIPAGTGNLVVFNNTLGWSNVYLYTSSGDLWANNNGCTTNGATRTNMIHVAGTNYWYAYVSGTIKSTLFLKDQQDNYGNVWETSASFRTDYSSSNPMFTPDTTSNETRNNTNYYSEGSWGTAPTISAESDSIELKDYLYNTGGTWNGVDKVWIYQSSSTEIVTLRSALLEAIDVSESAFTAGNDGIWTEESWSEFVTAYNTAVSTVGAGASTQEAIDLAAADLIAKKDALATQEKVSLTVTQSGATGTVSFGNVTVDTAIWTGDVNKGKSVTLNITAPNMYYISAVIVNGNNIYLNSENDESVLTKQIVTAPLSLDPSSIVVQYTERTTYTITVEAYGQDGGSLNFNGELIPAAGNVYTVCSGDNVTITAEPADGYGVYYWVVDSTSGNNRELTYSFNNVSKNHTIDVEWVELEEVTVSVVTKPNSAGISTVNGKTSDTVEQYTTVELKTEVKDPCYQFVGWTIEGAYYRADDTTANDTTFRIVASGTGIIKATANYDKVYKAVYLKNEANWSETPHLYYFGGSTSCGYPGDAMTYNSTLGYWVGYAPIDATSYKFNKGNDDGVQFENVGSNNLFSNDTSNTNYPTTYIESGYYLQGQWNGSSHSAYSNVKFEQQADNTYTLELTVTKTTDGYIYVNPTNELSHFWNAATNGATGNPQTLTATGAYQASPKQVKIEIDTTDFNKAYDLVITFNPTTREFSWTKAENVPTINIIATDGRGKNEADVNMNSGNGRVGKTTFDLETVKKSTPHPYYVFGQAVAGTPVTFRTQVNQNANGNYDYYVAGWVINGTEFVSATTMGDGLYEGSYIFTAQDNTVVPVYFHTTEWLTTNNVSTVTVYAVADMDIVNWNKYFAAYTWYKVSGVTQYEQFGPWSGQLMIPITGLDNVYYTIIETSTGAGTQISGITFNNYPSGDNIDNSMVTGYENIQTYDYYEFIALLEDGKENITFVIKDTNDTYNASRVNGNTVDIINGNWDFVQYTDYSGLKTDIFGNDIEDIDSTLSDSNALYVIQAGDKNYSGVGNLDGQWYVDCYLYKADGTYLGKCYSYELHDEDSAIWATLAAYDGQRAYISYEHVNGSRYDGEWYGDSDLSVTINLSVNVGLTTDGGNTYTINETSPVNVADYGTGYINVQYQNVDVTRGDTVTLTAMPKTGYKFVGWYSADGTCFTTNTTVTVTAAIGTTYTAVFDALDTGYYYVNHYIYQGIGTSTNYIPVPNGGNALLYVGIKNIKTGVESGFSQTNTAYVEAQEGDELLITVATDAIGADEFYAWYVDAVDSTGTTFEEVGVDTEDNLAMSDENNPYYMSGVNTVVGAQDRVYFSFKYTVKDGDSFSMNIYSDLIHVSIDRILVYNYNDRYGNVKSYYVPYTLNQQEIVGFAGNGFTPMKPAYISSPTDEWENTVLVNAPYVDDYYKDATWIINQTMFDTQTISLWATHNYPTYTVTYTVGDTVLVQKVPYNSLVEIDARDHSTTARNAGFWYEEIIKNSEYDKGVDIILCYGATYMYRVTKDMVINYQAVEEFDFNIMIDAPVYGREQTTDTQGNNKKDTIYIDYLNNILTPYMYGDTDKVTGEVYDTVHFGGEDLNEFWGADHVTVESLIAMGYELEYGMILEWVGAGLITETNTFEMAQEKAESNGYGTATDEETLKNVIENYSGTPNMPNGGKYYTLLSVNNPTLTNKNRYLFTMTMSNTENNQGKFYNVYGYLKVKAPYSDTWSYYTSNVQTLNIYECGTTEASTEENTTFN